MTRVTGRGRWIGAVLLAGGILAVMVVRRGAPDPAEPVPARPLKTMVIGEQKSELVGEFPGKVAAGEQVEMAFEADGKLTGLPVREGDRVKQGQVLARLDPRDAQNQLDAATAELQRAEAQRDRMRIAAEAKAVSLQELSDAEATYNIALAQRNIRQKALDDTELRASFDGIIARVVVKNFETVRPKEPILSLQDLTGVEIGASIPESQVANLRPQPGDVHAPRFRFSVVFEFLPDREFDLDFKEFTVEAEALTQTFTAKFQMPSPTDVTILPGMACTVRIQPLEGSAVPEAAGVEVPLDAVPIDGVGRYYVWLLRETGDGFFEVERRDVEVGRLQGDRVLVTEGLVKGDRIALAGVHVLTEGTVVRLLEPQDSAAP